MERKKVYLDFQIFDICSKEATVMDWIKNKTGYAYYCSTAHLEELHRALINARTETAKSKARALKAAICALCTPGVLNPSDQGIVLKEEAIDSCLDRIKTHDTTDIIKEHAKHLKASHRQSPEFSNSYNHSKEQWKTIWDERQIQNNIQKLNENPIDKNQIIALYEDLRQEYGHEKALFHSARYMNGKCEISFGCYQKIKNSYDKLEYVIEQLARILSYYGYSRDKNIHTFNSGEYDITHMIYGLFCNYFVSEDKKLRSRASAIYYYLQAPVQVMSLEEYKNMD